MIENSVNPGTPAGVAMYPSLMGTFNLPTPIDLVETRPVYTIGFAYEYREINVESFRTCYFNTPWEILDVNSIAEPNGFIGMDSPLSVVEIAYQALQAESTDFGQVFSAREEND